MTALASGANCMATGCTFTKGRFAPLFNLLLALAMLAAPRAAAEAEVVPGGSLASKSTLGQAYLREVEPNGTFGTATPLSGRAAVAIGSISPSGDVDFYSFAAAAGTGSMLPR